MHISSHIKGPSKFCFITNKPHSKCKKYPLFCTLIKFNGCHNIKNYLFSRKNSTFFKKFDIGCLLDHFRATKPKITSVTRVSEILPWIQISEVSHKIYTFPYRVSRIFLYLDMVLLSNNRLPMMSHWYPHSIRNCGSAKRMC